MKRITRISSLSDCGIFRNFKWPADLDDFGRYNLIYGWNGTGKTTLSRILRCLEKGRTPEGKVRVVLEGEEVAGDQFPNAAVQVRVFNRDFIEESVFPVGGGDLPPIFVLGAESVDKQKEIELLKRKRDDAQSKLDSAITMKQKAHRDFDQFCIDRARAIKDTLRSGGHNRYNNYDKSDFKSDAEAMAKEGDGSAYRLSESERERLLAQHRTPPKAKVQEVALNLPDLNFILKQVSETLRTTVRSAVIEALRCDHALAAWTRQGLQLHRERSTERCLFCEQPLPKERLAALEAHFSTQYEQFMKALDEQIRKLQELSKAAAELRPPNKAELYDDLAADYQSAEEGLRQALKTIQGFLAAVEKRLEEKKRRPFEELELVVEAPSVDLRAVEKLNEVIRKHNKRCDEFQDHIDRARKSLAEDMIAEMLQQFVSLRDAIQKAKESVEAAQNELERINAQITGLERDIVEHRRPAEELNEDLRKYLGHDELRLEVKNTGYAITRNGVPAKALSEGEMTAIALLYFLKSLQDKQFDLKNGVVVLDAPVSRLDAHALDLAFGRIRERTEDAGQLFILTHNFRFFREVRNWFHHLPGQKKRDPSQRPARFYMLECSSYSGDRCATIRWLDPLLEQYDSEYHYLFALVYRASTETQSAGLEQNYALPNIARRLLESFLAFRQPAIHGTLWQKTEGAQFEKTRKLRILRFLNSFSHSEAIGDPGHDLSLLAEAKAVLKDLLEFIETQDKAHFDAMVELIKDQTAEGNDK